MKTKHKLQILFKKIRVGNSNNIKPKWVILSFKNKIALKYLNSRNIWRYLNKWKKSLKHG